MPDTTQPFIDLPLEFHHVGIACPPDAQIKEREQLGLLGYLPEGEVWTDERLGMKGQFLVAGGCTGSPRIEVVIPYTDNSPVTPWLERGIKLYHTAYLVTDLSNEIRRIRNNGAKLMLAPTPAVAFDSRKIAFLMLPNRLLIELIEKG